MIHACPKPIPKEKSPRKPLRSKTWLSDGARKELRKVNPERQKERRKLTAKFHKTPAFIAAGEAAMKRARGRCEFVSTGPFAHFMTPGRCRATESLERHCKSYPKTRPITAKDITIYCTPHHQFVEMVDNPIRKRR